MLGRPGRAGTAAGTGWVRPSWHHSKPAFPGGGSAHPLAARSAKLTVPPSRLDPSFSHAPGLGISSESPASAGTSGSHFWLCLLSALTQTQEPRFQPSSFETPDVAAVWLGAWS